MNYKTKESGMSDLSADDLFMQATCSIQVNGEIKGTAWLFSHQGHLLTAGHVLHKEDALPEEDPLSEVDVKFLDDIKRKARRLYHDFSEKKRIDFAILQLESIPHNRRPLPISLTQSVSGEFTLYGYGTSLDSLSSGIGKFTGIDAKESISHKLFLLRCQDIAEEGYSGGAVFSDELQAVVAIQTETAKRRMGARRDTVLAMPLYRIANMWEPLKRFATISPFAQPKQQSTSPNILFTQTQTGQFTSTLPPQVQNALNECFARHRPLILRVAPHDSSVNDKLNALYGAFLTNSPDLNTIKTIKLVLAFFTTHYPSTLRQIKILLQEPTLQWLVRQGGGQMKQNYEQLVFAASTMLPICTRCQTPARSLMASFCTFCGTKIL